MQVALGPRPPLQLALGGASLKIARRPRPDGPHAEALAEKFLRIVARRRAQLLQQFFRPLTYVRAARAVNSSAAQRHRLAVLRLPSARGEREGERELVAGPRSPRQLS